MGWFGSWTNERLTDPHTHTYASNPHTTNATAANGGPVQSPVTQEPMGGTALIPVAPIRKMVLALVEAKLQALREA